MNIKINNQDLIEVEVNKQGQAFPLEIPKVYLLEMIADWEGVGVTYGNSLEDWLPNNIHNFTFSKQTAKLLASLLKIKGFKVSNFDQKVLSL